MLDLVTFFKQDFVIHGRIFRSLYSKEHTVFLVELAERTSDGITRNPDLTGCLSFPVFLEWHNPMHLNKTQVILGFDTSIYLSQGFADPRQVVREDGARSLELGTRTNVSARERT